METRANYLLIGAFTLLGVLGALGFFLWLAKVEVDRQYAYYDVLFESVAGLGEAGDVRYNGLPVGQVVSLGLDPEDPSKVRVRIEVSAQTPIKTDTVAKLESQGVTGVSYVGLSGGGADTPLLRATSDDPIPRITAEKSAFQSLFDSAPALLEKAIALLEDVNEVVNEENKAAVGTILSNLSSASGELDTVLKDFSGLSGDLSIAAREIASFTGTLETVAATANVTMLTAGETLTTAKEAIERAHTTIDNATEALAGARDAFASANTLMNDKLPGVIDQVNATAATVETVVTDVGGKAGVAIDGASAAIAKFDAVGDVAVARLTEAEATLAALDKALTQADATMKAIEAASNNVDTLVEGDGKALVASARQAVDSAKTLMAGRIPALIDRADGALGAVEKTVTDVGARIDTLAEVATARLTRRRHPRGDDAGAGVVHQFRR
jgi:phospholipid/cholesterol/gamma-HCH transport system substrate-binding protein